MKKLNKFLIKNKPTAIFLGTRIEALETLKRYFLVKETVTTKNSFVHKKYKKSKIIKNKNKKQIFSFIKNCNVNLVFSAGFPFIIPAQILNFDKRKFFLNSHPSYLPYYKGRKCIPRAFMNGESTFGATVHVMKKKIDSGEIIFQKKSNLKNLSLNKVYKHIFGKLEPEVIKISLERVVKQMKQKVLKIKNS